MGGVELLYDQNSANESGEVEPECCLNKLHVNPSKASSQKDTKLQLKFIYETESMLSDRKWSVQALLSLLSSV